MTQQSINQLKSLVDNSSFIADLNDRLPALDGRTLEERAMAASERGGAEGIIKEIIALSEQTEQAPMKSPHLDVTGFEQLPPPKQ